MNDEHYVGVKFGDISETNIQLLFGKKKLEDIQSKIASATGLAFVTVDYRGVPVTDNTAFCDFCRKIQDDPDAAQLCTSSNAFGCTQAVVLEKSYMYFCPCGLLEVAIPIVVHGNLLGGVMGGQTRCDDAPKDTVELAKVMPQNQRFLDEDHYLEQYNKIPKMTFAQFSGIVELVSMIVNQLAEKEVMQTMLNRYEIDIQNLRLEEAKNVLMEQKLISAGIEVFNAHIYPFFVLSVLSTIADLAAVEKAEKTNETVVMLASFLRNRLQEIQEVCSFAEELELVDSFLKIEKAHYSELLTFNINVKDAMLTQKIPSLIIFVFVECLMRYSITYNSGSCAIVIDADYEDDEVVVRIADENNKYFGEETDEKLLLFCSDKNTIHHVIQDAQKRFREYFGLSCGIDVGTESHKGTMFTVRFNKLFYQREI